MSDIVNIEDVRSARSRISGFLHRTPVLTSTFFDAQTGATLLFKCENFQKGGAFKARGAHNAVYLLSDAEAAHGVVTHSSGNHAAALALAAGRRGIPAYIVMPSNSSAVKKAAVAGYGAHIVECEPTATARSAAAARIVAETGGQLIHPFDDARVIAGQGTAALELLEDHPGLDLVLAPVGGGGLISGTAIAVKESGATNAAGRATRVVGVEPELADDAWRSFHSRTRVVLDSSSTVADGLRTSLGEQNFRIVMRHVNDVVTVSEASIVAAMRATWERMKIVIEPSAAVPLAAVLEGRIEVRGLRVGIIVSGGNVDLGALPWRPTAG